MASNAIPFLGLGMYSLAEAAKLTRVPYRRIGRWVKGYSYVVDGERVSTPAVFCPQFPIIDGQVLIGFRDLMEIRVIDAFRRRGISWPTIRRAGARFGEALKTSHPFSNQKMFTQRKTILGRISEDAETSFLMDGASGQYVIEDFVKPYLEYVEFDPDGNPLIWRPEAGRHLVVVDPRRSYGQPIVDDGGVPTSFIERTYRTEQSADNVADWYSISVESVIAAIDFERSLDSAA